MTVSMLVERLAKASQTHASVRVGQVQVSPAVTVRRPRSDDFQAPLMHVWVGSRGLRRPIRVAVEIESDGTYLVEDPASGIFGEGAVMSEAIEDFRAALVSHRDELLSADRLSAHLQDQLTYLSDILG